MEEMKNTPETHTSLPFENSGDTPIRPVFPIGRNEFLFCCCILVSSLALCNSILYGFNLGFAIFSLACIISTVLYLHGKGLKGSWYSRSILALCLVIAAGFARSDDSFVKLVMLCFLWIGVNLGLCLTAGQNRRAPGSASSLLDAFRTVFSLGFGKLSPVFTGLHAAFRRSGSFGKRTSSILLGLGISIPLLAIVIPLLTSADAAFDGLIAMLPSFDLRELLLTLFWGFPLGCVLFSRGVALSSAPAGDPKPSTPRKGFSALTMNTVLVTICAVYFVYLVSQLAYFVSGLAGILPAGFSAAEYARRGFFEMAWLSAIDLALMILSISLVSKQPQAPKSTRLLNLFIGCVTLFFVVAAYAKMILYVGIYGLTRLRVLTMVIMSFLAITTILVSLWLFIPKLQYMKAVILIGLSIGAAIFWCDVDTMVARYNVDAYLSGRLETVDIFYLGSLGDGTVEYIEHLGFDAPDENIREAAWAILEERHYDAPEDFREWNYTSWYAGITMGDYESS